jgi:hypothetical protein
MSPALASSIALRVKPSASPSSSASTASVVLFLAPAGLPIGLPLKVFSFVSVLYFQPSPRSSGGHGL